MDGWLDGWTDTPIYAHTHTHRRKGVRVAIDLSEELGAMASGVREVGRLQHSDVEGAMEEVKSHGLPFRRLVRV
jgi:hypothetical protein